MRRLLALMVGLGLGVAQTVIPFWHTMDPPGRDLMETFVAEFNARQRDYRIEARYVGDIREGGVRLAAALRAGSQPAMYYAEVSFVARSFADNLSVPLDPYLGSLPDDLYGNLMEVGKFRGRTLALPVELQVPVFFYNADQFGARGLNPPRTWEDVANAAQRLTSRAARGYILSSDIYSFSALVMSWGGSIIGPDGKPSFTEPKVVAALEYLQTLVQRGWAQSRPIDQLQFSIVDFLRTKAMMVVAPITLWPTVVDRANIPFRLGVAPMPRVEGGKVPLGGGTLTAIRGASEAQARGVVAFWRYMMEPANINRWVRETYALPMRRNALPLLEPFYAQDPRRRVALSQIPDAQRWISDPEATIWYDALERSLEAAIQGGQNARQALERAQQQALSVERR
ncbi:MAG: extracellular solute-binding protein [Meiothermus sp.]|nr:extracellular solute-binding protein [Meiothermus sp.]